MSSDFPQMIGKYQIIEIISKKDDSVLYKAYHPTLKRYVVIKKISVKSNSSESETLKKEVDSILDLQSPYILHLFDYFIEKGNLYIVEEFVDGTSADKLLEKQNELPVPVAMLIMQDACYALKYAHSHNLVHENIKSENIMISKRGEIKISDFSVKEKTFLSDKRTDIYSLGTTFKKLLSLNKKNKKVPKYINRLVKKMCRPKMKKRCKTVDEALKKIKKYLSHYDTHELRVQLAKSVYNKNVYAFPAIEPKDKKIKKIRRIILGVIIATVVFACAWSSGLIHKYILKKWYSAVSIQVVMPKTVSGKMDLPAKAYFFYNDEVQKIPDVKGGTRVFVPLGSGKLDGFFSMKNGLQVERIASKNKTYVMKDMYLKDGDYRVKVVVGSYVWWKSFSVNGEDVEITCDFLKNKTRDLNIITQAFDADSYKDISSKVQFDMYYEHKWVPLEKVPQAALKSASVIEIKCSAQGYETEYYSFLFDWYQDEIVISSSLKKK